MGKNPYLNHEGYADPTAYYGTKDLIKEEEKLYRQVHDLCHIIRDVCAFAGFELLERVQLKHKKTGKEFRYYDRKPVSNISSKDD